MSASRALIMMLFGFRVSIHYFLILALSIYKAYIRNEKGLKEDTGIPKKIDIDIETEESEADIKRLLTNNTKDNFKEIIICTNASPIRSKVGRDYLCCFCTDRFKDPAKLKEHSRKHLARLDKDQRNERILKQVIDGKNRMPFIKLDITNLTCKLCGMLIKTLEELLQHLVEIHKRIMHLNIKNLIIPFKFETEEMVCCVCSKEFASFKCLVEHMNTHTTNFVCDLCSATFIAMDRLKSHIKLRHALGEFKCNFCPKIFNMKVKLYQHERRMHRKANEVKKCDYCDENFETQWAKQKHQFKFHGVTVSVLKKVTCDLCVREFPNVGTYKTHFRRFHLLEKSHQCEYCKMRFFDIRQLQIHIVKHTGEKNYQCDLCMKAFALKKSLRKHLIKFSCRR
ncbi:unnamed protein product [Pieris macdunnoughi]|uniref:C2H2-type domain-containing protein n=1 Tax=Pieris macdunnoughi TaxID=345717 RepID=A0A821UF38_9NEOP|nr:unnamed protein product [Pieris macdunnoughi]